MPNVVHQYLHLFKSTYFQGKLLKHNLDSEVVDALKDLRRTLSENELKTQKGIGLEAPRLSGKKHGINVKAVEKVSAIVEGNGKVVNDEVGVKGVGNGAVRQWIWHWLMLRRKCMLRYLYRQGSPILRKHILVDHCRLVGTDWLYGV
ncbi:hypothetical protein CFP56_011666 [Quercus suber]|uniref:Uncharacterized protein n=1 Tax=Quercus suber TaxID=58331 RepID=A0AAW0KY33_QUESU